jgi:hypothetical protein
LLEGHFRLRGGKNNNGESLCSAKNIHDHIILGSKFKTDFTEIRLKNTDASFVNDKKLTYSLGVIFTKSLSEYLAIEESELGFGIKKYKNYQTIFIYDTARGGAGYASQFSMYTQEILNHALEILNGCSCQSACTKCLIDRSTQWHIEDLDRYIAISWLQTALINQLPEEFKSTQIEVNSIFGSLKDEIKRLNYHYGIEEVTLYVNNCISEWNIDNLAFLESLKRDNITVNLVVEDEIEYSNIQEKLSVHILSYNYKLFKGNGVTILNYPVHLSLTLSDDTKFNYISKSNYQNLDDEWIDSDSITLYKVENSKEYNYDQLILPDFSSSKLYESRVITIPRFSKSNDLAKIMISNLKNPNDFLSKIKNQIFRVSYFDKYNLSEFSLRLLLQFIDELKNIGKFYVESLEVNLTKDVFRYNNSPRYIIQSYNEIEDYSYDLEKLSKEYDFTCSLIETKRLPHYRYFEFKTDNLSFSIRIDGGIAHGLKPVERLESEDMRYKNQIFEIRKDVYHDIIYNISFEK